MIRASRCALALIVLTLAAGTASAQSSMEVAALAGYTPTIGLEQHAPELTDLNLRGAFTWGIEGTRFFTPQWGASVVFTQQISALEAVTTAGAGDLYRITLAQIQANVVYQFGAADARLRPFVFGGAGATLFSARDLDSSTKASFGFGGGVKYFPWKTIGLRGQLRYNPTWLNDDPESDQCDPFGFCQAWLRPFEFTGGVVIRF